MTLGDLSPILAKTAFLSLSDHPVLVNNVRLKFEFALSSEHLGRQKLCGFLRAVKKKKKKSVMIQNSLYNLP